MCLFKCPNSAGLRTGPIRPRRSLPQPEERPHVQSRGRGATVTRPAGHARRHRAYADQARSSRRPRSRCGRLVSLVTLLDRMIGRTLPRCILPLALLGLVAAACTGSPYRCRAAPAARRRLFLDTGWRRTFPCPATPRAGTTRPTTPPPTACASPTLEPARSSSSTPGSSGWWAWCAAWTRSTGSYPDGLAYALGAGKVYVSNEHDSVDTVIDARSARRLGSIP